MSYWISKGKNVTSVENYGLGGSTSAGDGAEFYELEPAVVLDVVLDKDHPIFKTPNSLSTTVDVERWPSDLKDAKPKPEDVDYSWIGRVLVRMQYSTPSAQKEKLIWASPMDSSVSEYPLVNEVVIVMKYRNKYFYGRKLNTKNFPNEAIDFSINPAISGQQNTELFTNKTFQGVTSKTNHEGTSGFKGVAGKYYKVNNRIRRIKRYEGDTVIESRFGQSIRFGAYDSNRANDKGKDSDYADGGGNPMIVIRNRQRKLLKEGETLQLKHSPNPATVKGTKEEKNAGGCIEENINHDGSTIAITSGNTISEWKPTCFKHMFGNGEEVGNFNGKSSFKYPVLNGDQVIIQSDRLIFSSRYGETFHYSKKRFAVVTDSEYTVDANDQIVMTTNVKTVLNSPQIYLGEYDNTKEPVLLGQTSVEWLGALCDWLAAHTHKHEHGHVNAGAPSPKTTQTPVEDPALVALKALLPTLLSKRVFVVGGGYAPGSDGAKGV